MQRGRLSGGYTVVETMIFLAVSGFMFIVAATFIQGKQSTAQFTQSMNSINTEVRQIINYVSDNNYTSQQLQCVPSFIPSQPLSIQTSTTTDYGCIYLGKFIQFAVGNNPSSYNVYTVAGCQFTPCSNTVDPSTATLPENLSQADAQVIDPGVSDTCAQGASGINANNKFNLTSCNSLEWGLRATKMFSISSSTYTPTNSVGFFGSFAPTSGTSLSSGAQSVDVLNTGYHIGGSNIDITSSASNVDEKGMVAAANSYLEGSSANPITTPYFVVCFDDARGNYGALTIGGGNGGSASGQRLTTSIQMSTSPIALNASVSCN